MPCCPQSKGSAWSPALCSRGCLRDTTRFRRKRLSRLSRRARKSRASSFSNWYISESSPASQSQCLPPPPSPLIPANKRESVLSITICAYKSILYPSFSLSLLRATIVFLLPLPKWTLFTLKKGKGKKDTLLKNPGDVLIASPLHHGWKIRGCEMWIPKPVAAGSCGDKRRKPMLDCPL